MTTFYRLLKDTDKATALRTAVTARRSGDTDTERTFTVDPAAFSKVPNTPFAYWVDDEIRDLFVKLPPFESEGRTVKQGLATADDFRFVRAWWEVDPARRLDPGLGGAPDWREDLEGFQAWCRRRTHKGKGWAPFAKGGEYSPYYSDIHLVVNWEREGLEIKNNRNEGGEVRSNVKMLAKTEVEYFFRPGVTWPARPHRRGGFSAVGAGALFSHVGTMVFSPPEQFTWLLGLLNSDAYIGLLHLLMPRGTGDTGQTLKYEIGYVKSVPLPPFGETGASIQDELVMTLATKKREIASMAEEVSPVANTHYGRYGKGTKIDESSISKLNQSAAESYDLTSSSIDLLATDLPSLESLIHDDYETDYIQNAFQNVVGVAFSRWDLRLALNPDLVPALPNPFDPLPVVPPATLVGPDGLPATTGRIVSEEWLRARPNAITLPLAGSVTTPTITDDEYAIPIPWDGILVDDPDHPADIVARIRQALTILHGERTQQTEEELCAELEVDNLREYIRNPKGFFADHLSRYSKSRRKAPIYWPLSTPSGGWTAWIYYPRLTDATIYTLIDRYLRPRREVVQQLYEEIDRIPAASRTRSQQRQCDEAARDGEELAAMEEDLKQIAAMPYRPNHDDGVPILASPFHRYFRHREWAKYLTGIRQSLEAGEYDWAHLAYAVWPERVREKARTDRSIAIAHGIEEET